MKFATTFLMALSLSLLTLGCAEETTEPAIDPGAQDPNAMGVSTDGPHNPADAGGDTDAKPADTKDGGDAKPADAKDGGDAKPADKKDGGDAKPAAKKKGGDAKPAPKKDGGDKKPAAKKKAKPDYGAMTGAQLKAELKKQGLPVSGKKAELVKRLQKA